MGEVPTQAAAGARIRPAVPALFETAYWAPLGHSPGIDTDATDLRACTVRDGKPIEIGLFKPRID